ncbi:hypothetical protein BDV28DRAFT_163224 [Aspergillus coremiiformis]|uniref:P-loop containing nucleoside triphosphate hydrolase protein n=1 Tax=Aspergillus coremiiformis TaxID=138285 RepID=A0A5N6YYP9_9EURO|nr:hypothetical protein BDV28DRAFT_163224 [Aspergillus coremiiformis]
MLSLEHQENVISNEKGGYFFWDAFMKGRTTMSSYTPVKNWTAQQTSEMQTVCQQNFKDVESKSQLAESHGNIFFAKEHVQWFTDPAAISNFLWGCESRALSPVNITIPASYDPVHRFSPNNLTIFPDRYLETWRLTFLIRHPALAFPSFYRAMRELEKEEFAQPHEVGRLMELNATLRWTRLLYGWCCEHQRSDNGCDGATGLPILLDAQDVIHHPEVVVRYCELIGLNPAHVRVQWDAESSQMGNHPLNGAHKSPDAVMKFTLANSSHILKDKTPAVVDIALQRKRWDEEFGKTLGQQMERWVREAMPDYDYLRSRRLQVKDQ